MSLNLHYISGVYRICFIFFPYYLTHHYQKFYRLQKIAARNTIFHILISVIFVFVRIFSILLLIVDAHAVLRIDVSKGVVVPEPIAIVSFSDNDGKFSQDGTNISEVIENDLKLSGRFAPINKQLFVEKSNQLVQKKPAAANWRVIGARFLVYGKVLSNGSKLKVSFSVFDVMNSNIMMSATIEGTKNTIRKIAHKISDMVFKRILNEDSYFSCRVVCVKTVKFGINRTTCLIAADHDGKNQQILTETNKLLLMPTPSPDGNSIAFVVNMMNVCTLNLKTMTRATIIGTKQRKLLERGKKMRLQGIVAPRFVDASTIVMTCTMDGKSAIFFYKIGKEFVQETTFSCIQTVPFVRGNTMILTSDASGTEKIYTKSLGSSIISRVGDGSGKQSCPIFVANKIVFVKTADKKFHLCVMNKDGTKERVILSAYFLDSVCPCGGGYVAYEIKHSPNSTSQIGVIHINGYGNRILDIKGDLSQPIFVGYNED